MKHYILVDRVPVEEPDLLLWATWKARSQGNCRVALTSVGGYDISTVFLGLDHRLWGKGPPLLFETMLFAPGGTGLSSQKCSTWAQAEAQHQDVLHQMLVVQNG